MFQPDAGSVQGAYTGGYSSGSTGPTPDALRSGFNTQKGIIQSSATGRAAAEARNRGSSIQDFIQGLQSTQSKIDEQGVQNELAKKQGTQGVMGMVSRGIRSGATTLANKNASNSSAAYGIANAYGDIGRRELSGVGQQYEQGNREIGLQQADLERQRASGLGKYELEKTNFVEGLVQEVEGKLGELNAAMINASLPDRIAIEQEKEAVKQQALALLGEHDAKLNQGAAGVQATSTDQRRGVAAGLLTQGTAPENPFNFAQETPSQFQNSPFSGGGLPIFTRPRNREV